MLLFWSDLKCQEKQEIAFKGIASVIGSRSTDDALQHRLN